MVRGGFPFSPAATHFQYFITGRAATFLNAYAALGYVNTVGGPTFSVADRAILNNGDSFTISSTASGNLEIMYTTNGQDPR